jgi:hypothetical protein
LKITLDIKPNVGLLFESRKSDTGEEKMTITEKITLDSIMEDNPGFDLMIDGELYAISRNVCTDHPAEVHEALGTSSESELQMAIDQCNYSFWFGANGEYLGRDENGLGIVGL